MASKSTSSLHDSFNPQAQGGGGDDYGYFHAAFKEGRSAENGNPNTYEELMSFYLDYDSPSATFKQAPTSVHRSAW